MMCGGQSAVQPMNEEAQVAFDAVKAQVAQLQGTYEVVGFTQQVVAGIMYRFTVKTDAEEIVVKVWRKVDGTYELQNE